MPEPVRLVFVCWGNICRSPMAERVAERQAEQIGLTGLEISSAATSSEELGAPIDRRAQAVLRRHGYRTEGHRAHRISADELAEADLVIAMEDIHVDRLRALGTGGDKIRLLTDFDPGAEPGSGVPDPWYGSESGFEGTLDAIEAAMPGVLEETRRLVSAKDGQRVSPSE